MFAGLTDNRPLAASIRPARSASLVRFWADGARAISRSLVASVAGASASFSQSSLAESDTEAGFACCPVLPAGDQFRYPL